MAVSDIIIAPATVYYAPVGEPLPSVHTIDFGEAWGGNWVNVGYTLTPISMKYNQELFSVEVEQVTLPVKRARVKEELMIETTLAEITMANLGLSMDGTVTMVAAGASQRAHETFEVGGKTAITERAWGFEGFFKYDGASNQYSLPIRVFVFKANSVLNGNLEFSKKAAVGIPLQINGLGDSGKVLGKQLAIFQKVTSKTNSE